MSFSPITLQRNLNFQYDWNSISKAGIIKPIILIFYKKTFPFYEPKNSKSNLYGPRNSTVGDSCKLQPYTVYDIPLFSSRPYRYIDQNETTTLEVVNSICNKIKDSFREYDNKYTS